MQIILFENVDKLGMQGDVVNVAAGYYRNFLGPRGKALEATPGNLKRLESKRSKLKAQAEKQVQEAKAFAGHLSKAEVKFVMKSPDGKKLFGSIHDHEIADKLIEQGFALERRQVMHEPLKEVGTHKIKVKLVGHVEATVNVIIEAEGAAEAAKAAEAAAAAAARESAPEAEPEAESKASD